MAEKIQEIKKSLSGQDSIENKSLGRESLTDKPQQSINTINAQPQVRLQDKPSIETETD